MPEDLQLLALDQAPREGIEPLVRDHGVSRFLVEPAFTVEPRHGYLWELIEADAAGDDAVATVVLREGRVVGLCVLRYPAWDREHFGFVVGRVEHLIGEDRSAIDSLIDWVVDSLREHEATMCSARLYIDALPALQSLEARGFRFQEHTLTPWRRLTDWEPRRFGVTRPAEPEDLPRMCDIARLTFRTDRFHRDPRFDPLAADGVYEKWVRGWHAKPGADRFSIALIIDGDVAGFSLFELISLDRLGGARILSIVLTGVDPKCAGRGNGYRLLCDELDLMQERAQYATTPVFTGNMPVVNLFVGKLGFRLSGGGELTLHRWE